MKKLRLSVEDLQVESFAAGPVPANIGTVQGRALGAPIPPDPVEPGTVHSECYSHCNTACEGSCVTQCDTACVPSQCPTHCNQTCDWQCEAQPVTSTC